MDSFSMPDTGRYYSRHPEAPPVQLLNRLSPEVYRDLESKLPRPALSGDANPTQAAYLLGVQHVLGVLRAGFVVGE
jgi:hypothetical protein